jgi:hypothetical protein
VFGKKGGQEVIKPGEREIEKEIIASDTPIIEKNSVGTTLMNGGDVSRLQT